MPLPPSAAHSRRPLQTRTTSCSSFLRDDGLWEIEGYLIDTRSYDHQTRWRGQLPQGAPIHDMRMRIVFDDDLTIRDIAVAIDAAPYPEVCPQAVANYHRLIGQRLGKGFMQVAQQYVGKTAGCTHQTVLLQAMNTTATRTYNTHAAYKAEGGAEQAGMPEGTLSPVVLGTCHSFTPDSPIVAYYWPTKSAEQAE